MPRLRLARRRRRVEAVDVREQHEQIRPDHGRDARREAVVVAVADLGGGGGVVLVDDRHGAHLEQLLRRGARVEVATPLLGIGEGDEDLPGRDAVPRQHLRPDARQGDLADGGGGLALLELQRAGGEAEHGAAEGDGAGRDHQHIGAAPVQPGDVLRQRREPAFVRLAARPVDEQGRADLEHDAAELVEGGDHGRAARNVGLPEIVAFIKQRSAVHLGDGVSHAVSEVQASSICRPLP